MRLSPIYFDHFAAWSSLTARCVEAVAEEDGLACDAVVEYSCVLLQLDAFEGSDACAKVVRGGRDVFVHAPYHVG